MTTNDKGEDVLPGDNKVKTNGTVTFDVEAGGTYYVMVSGSKMGFFGFKYSITATVGTAGYATFCSTATCKVPSGLTAYTAAYNATSGKVDLTEVADGIIPANNGVILKGEAKEYTMETATSEVKSLTDNELVGVTADYTLTDKDYILVNDGGVVKFGKATVGTTLAEERYIFQSRILMQQRLSTWTSMERQASTLLKQQATKTTLTIL